MLDIKFIRENPEQVQKGAKDKNIDVDVTKILEVDSEYRALSTKLQELFAARNAAAKERDIEKGKSLKSDIDQKESVLNDLKQALDELLLNLPNIAKEDVKVGKNDTENDVIKTVGEVKKFNFTPKDHVELGQLLDIIDIERATKVSGSRFAYLKNEGALLELALVQFAMETLSSEGFTPIVPPTIITKETMKKLGYMENGGDEDMFQLKDNYSVLVGTAEQSIVPMHLDEVFPAKDLPKRYVGFSSSFRREAGSYGKDTRGILRVHQFDKVEMVSFVSENQDDNEHDYLLSLEEKFFQALEIPYQVIKMCTGDLGFPVARKYDIEAYIPTQEKYREVTSTSTTTDFQARRLNIKYQDGDEKKFVHVLNGTAFAIGRTLIAILENYQEEDGSVIIPEVLRKYIPGNLEKITPKK